MRDHVSLLHFFNFEGKSLVFEPVLMELFQVGNNGVYNSTSNKKNISLPFNKDELKYSTAKEKKLRLHRITEKLSKINSEFNYSRKSQLNTLWLNISHSCNLRCIYCFANCGDYGGKTTLMNSKISQKSIDFLFDNIKYGKNARIVFFGGEPLVNWRILKSCVLYAESSAKKQGINVRFVLITNGTLIDNEILDFIKSHKIHLQFSIDGPSDINDHLRPTKSGGSSFESTYKALNLVRQSGIEDVAVRATITHFNCKIAMIHEFMQYIGFKKIGMTPVQAACNNVCYLTKNDIITLRREYKKLASRIIRTIRLGEETELGCFSPYVLQLLRGNKNHYYCGAGFNSLCVTPEGKIYPCHRLISKSECEFGSVFSPSSAPSKQIGAFPVEAKDFCCTCWARYFCGGGCEAAAYDKHGTFNKPDETLCKVTKAVAENALKIYYVILTG